MPGTKIEEGSTVLIHFDRKRRFVAKVRPEARLATDKGVVELGDLIGKAFGTIHRSSIGVRFAALRPQLVDLLMHGFKRMTQVIYPKDLGFILLLSGVGPGSRVVEAGTGSGFLTAVLAFYVRPNGRVYTYDVRKECIELAKRNLELAGLLDYVEFKLGDVRKGIEERDVDAVILDMPSPWEALNSAYEALKPSSPLICFLPTISQVEKTIARILSHGGFLRPSVFEIMMREYKAVPGELRPETWMVGHTGYIIYTRKVVKGCEGFEEQS